MATIIAAEALGYLKANTVLARLVARDWDDQVATHGQSVAIPFTGALSVNDKAANTVVTRQTPADTKVTVTLNKHKEVTFLIEDIAAALARPDYLNAYMADGMAVLSEQIDGDIAALYSGLSQSIDASAGLTEANFRNARRLLNVAKAPLANRYAVLNEDAEYELLGIEKATNRDYVEAMGQTAANSFTGRFAGFDIFMCQKIVTSTTVKNLFFQKNAFVLVTRPLQQLGNGMGVIQKTMNEDGIGIRVTLGYDKDHLGLQCTIDALYGVAELRDNHGVTVLTADI